MLLKRCDRCGRIRTLNNMNESVIKIYQGSVTGMFFLGPSFPETKAQYYADLCDYCYEDFIKGYEKFMKQ